MRARPAGWLDDARLRHQVRAPGSADVRPKRARLSGRRAICRRCEPCRLAKGAAAARAGAEAAGQLALCAEVSGPVLEVSGLVKRFGGFTPVNNASSPVHHDETPRLS